MNDLKYIEQSIIGFNGSPHCNRSCVGSFLESYKNRKDNLISNQNKALAQGSKVNEHKLWWRRESLKEVLDIDNAKILVPLIQEVIDSRYSVYADT